MKSSFLIYSCSAKDQWDRIDHNMYTNFVMAIDMNTNFVRESFYFKPVNIKYRTDYTILDYLGGVWGESSS